MRRFMWYSGSLLWHIFVHKRGLWVLQGRSALLSITGLRLRNKALLASRLLEAMLASRPWLPEVWHTRQWPRGYPREKHDSGDQRSYMSIVLSFRKSLCSGFSTSTTPHG